MPPREEGDAARVLDNEGDNTVGTRRLANQISIVTWHLGVTIVVRGAREEEGAWSSREDACKQRMILEAFGTKYD